MTRQLFKRTAVLFGALIFLSSVSFSQIEEKFDFLKGGIDDGSKFLKAYISPWTNAFGAGLNGGWYNTAKPHKLLGFDITTSINVGVVPTSDGEFDISSLGLTTITGSGKTSTVSGPDKSGPSLYLPGNIEIATTPPGTNWRYIPVPTAQVGIGLPMGSELKVRFVPQINIQGGGMSLWGVGLLHNITQYFPGDKLFPFDVSVFGGYTKLEANVPMSIQPDTDFSNYTSPYSMQSFENQKLNMNVTALNVSAIGSINLPVITFYGGLGYSKTKTTMELLGNYPTPVIVNGSIEYNNTGVKTGSSFKNLEMENFSGLRTNIGFRIKLAVITIHADYTRAQYNVISTGLGISFR
jgi:hypothetical protein